MNPWTDSPEGSDSQEPRPGRECRRWPRRRVFKHVQVLSLDRKAASALDLTLRNISASGAQLFGQGGTLGRVPDEFYLVPPGQLRMVRCAVVWRTRNAAGVRFLSDFANLFAGETEEAAEAAESGGAPGKSPATASCGAKDPLWNVRPGRS